MNGRQITLVSVVATIVLGFVFLFIAQTIRIGDQQDRTLIRQCIETGKEPIGCRIAVKGGTR